MAMDAATWNCREKGRCVKAMLIANFKIDAARLKTEGKGETNHRNNTTSEGKANNRRVEFIKG